MLVRRRTLTSHIEYPILGQCQALRAKVRAKGWLMGTVNRGPLSWDTVDGCWSWVGVMGVGHGCGSLVIVFNHNLSVVVVGGVD